MYNLKANSICHVLYWKLGQKLVHQFTFFNGQTEVRIPVGIGQKSVFLEQCWGLEGDGLLKARPHTNVRYSNEQSGPSEYYSQYRHPTMCDIVRVYQFLANIFFFFFFFRNFCLIKVSIMRIFEKAQYDMSDMLLCHPIFTARTLHDSHQ